MTRPPETALDLSRTPGHLIRRAQQMHVLLWVRHVGTELTGPQFALLSAVVSHPGLDQTTAGDLASLDKSTTAATVRRLLRHGWLTAGADPADRRRKLPEPGGPAAATVQALTGQVTAVQEHLLAPLEPTRRTALVTGLAALAYDGHPPASAGPGPGLAPRSTPGYLIRRAQQAVTARWGERFGGEMTGPQYAVLCAVAVHGSADRSTVVETASLDKSTVAEVVDRLTGRGLLLPDRDRRGKKLMLSDTARRRLPDFTRGPAAVNADTMALLPSPDHEPFLDALADVAYRAGST